MLRKPLSRLQNVRSVTTAKPPKLPDCTHTPSSYKGRNYDSIKAAHENRVSPSLKPFYKKPLLLHEGRGQWVWDHEGKRYLDMFGGICTVSVGHSHPKIVDAINEQASKLGHTSTIYLHPRFLEYAEKLTSKLPDSLSVVYLTNSGSEANELAFLLARCHTGVQGIVSLRNCYHGGTWATAASTGMSTWKYQVNQPAGYFHVMNPDVYKGLWGGSRCRDCPVSPIDRKCSCERNQCLASDMYFQELEEVFRYSLPNKGRLAAFIAESIQGIGGVVQYPKTFLSKAYALVREKGGLCISDEVQTGFGRTGEHFWGFEGHGVLPDIVTMAKGIGNGFPLGAVVTTPEIAENLNAALHFNTFGGNPVACAVGSTVLDIIEEEGLQENSQVVGTHMLHRLSTLLLDFPNIVGDVRGKGLMIGVELISDRRMKKPLEAERMAEVFEDIKEMGVLVGKGGLHANVLRIKPPMCVTIEDADYTVEVIKRALQRHRDKYLLDQESVYMRHV